MNGWMDELKNTHTKLINLQASDHFYESSRQRGTGWTPLAHGESQRLSINSKHLVALLNLFLFTKELILSRLKRLFFHLSFRLVQDMLFYPYKDPNRGGVSLDPIITSAQMKRDGGISTTQMGPRISTTQMGPSVISLAHCTDSLRSLSKVNQKAFFPIIFVNF